MGFHEPRSPRGSGKPRVGQPAPARATRHSTMTLANTAPRCDPALLALANGGANTPVDGGMPLTDQEILAAAKGMSMAAGGTGGGVRLVSDLLNPQLELKTMALRIEACPEITVRILRVANSAFYGQSGTIATVARAVQVLGMNTVKGIAAAACLDHMVVTPANATTVDLVEFRRHSVATASACQTLARRIAPAHAEHAFVAGLLHDLGVMVQWRLRPAGLVALRAKAAGAAGDMTACRRRALERPCTGTTHADCARILLGAWNLPVALVDSVAAHEGSMAELTAAGSLATLVAAADELAAAAGYPLATEPGDPAPEQRLAGFWNEHAALREEVLAALPDAVTRLCSMFDS